MLNIVTIVAACFCMLWASFVLFWSNLGIFIGLVITAIEQWRKEDGSA